jgi:hypothetical protein
MCSIYWIVAGWGLAARYSVQVWTSRSGESSHRESRGHGGQDAREFCQPHTNAGEGGRGFVGGMYLCMMGELGGDKVSALESDRVLLCLTYIRGQHQKTLKHDLKVAVSNHGERSGMHLFMIQSLCYLCQNNG